MAAGRGRVVVGVSGSLASLAALRVAAHTARESGRTLVAALAWEPPEGEVLYVRSPDSAWAAQCEREARGRLDRAFDEVFGGTPAGVAVRRRVIRGRPDRVLLAGAADPADLLVLGTRTGTRVGPRRAAVRRRVLARARCPVLMVPTPELPRRDRRALRRATAEDFEMLA
ncbi:universal stress protein [Streptomyces sp. NPDC060223]|uniref:universal stress protein n=1 Tax=unclassified Streptomyces TaxID=2593676 RepID=UPI00362B37CC